MGAKKIIIVAAVSTAIVILLDKVGVLSWIERAIP